VFDFGTCLSRGSALRAFDLPPNPAQWGIQRSGQLLGDTNTYLNFAKLNGTYVGPVDAGLVREILLG